MCDQVASDKIDEVVKEWIAQGRAFTSYDVSKEVQNRFKTAGTINWGEHRHSQLRDYYRNCPPLRNEVEYGDYKEQVVDVGQGLQATLYFPTSYDVANYKPLPRHGGPTRTQAAPLSPVSTRHSVPSLTSVPASSTSTPTVRNPPSVLSDDTIKVQDKLSILRIPKSVMLAAGFIPGDEVYVVKDNDTVVLSKQDPGLAATTLAIKKVEDRGGLRFYRSVRAKVLGMNGDTFNVKADSSQKKVSVAEV